MKFLVENILSYIMS